MDTAIVRFSNLMNNVVSVWTQSNSCIKCPLKFLSNVSVGDNYVASLSTNGGIDIAVTRYNKYSHEDMLLCQSVYRLREYGNYSFYITPNAENATTSAICYAVPQDERWDYLTPFYFLVAAFFLLILLLMVWTFLKERGCSCVTWFTRGQVISYLRDTMQPDNVVGVDEGLRIHHRVSASSFSNNSPPRASESRKRLEALDTFRGLAIILMIAVNYGGGGYWFLAHSPWNGLTLADLPFPWFVFIMGTSIALGFNKWYYATATVPYWRLSRGVLKRGVILALIGLGLNSHAVGGDFNQVRIPGVLQRLALTYVITAALELIILWFRRRRCCQSSSVASSNAPTSLNRADSYSTGLPRCRLWLTFLPYLLLIVVFVSTHITISLLIPQPSPCPTGYIGPGGYHSNGDYANCTGGIARVIDEVVFGRQHIYQRPSCSPLYHSTLPFDPEGLLGTLTSVALCIMGVLTGRILTFCLHWPTSSGTLCFLGVVTMFCGLGLCDFSFTAGWIPLNKNLWSASYVLFVGGTSFLILVAMFLLIDAGELWSGAPFTYAGKNSIFLYVAHEVFEDYFPVSIKVPRTHSYLLLMNTWSVLFWLLVSYVMFRKKIFLSV